MRARDVGAAAVVWVSMCAVAGPLAAQDANAWRVRYAAGEEARRAGDDATYADEMAAAAEVMPEGLLNRPFIQYHAARAAALDGRADEAVRWLSVAWDEGIESLMISFAPYDPAFASLVGSAGFEEVMGRAAAMRLTVRPMGGRVQLIEGAGANVVALATDDGVLLVDTGYGPALPALRRAVEGLGAGPVRMLIITHPHEDHMGSAAELGAEARIVAHPGTDDAMSEPYVFMDGVSLPPKPASAHPELLVAHDTVIDFGGERVRLVPTLAHTAGDLSVYFPGARVAHLGDAYLPGNPMMYPGTTDPDAFLDRFEAFLDDMDPETVVIGGHEAPADIAAVRAQIAQSREAMALVREALDEGLTIEETAERGADRFPPQWIAFFYQLFSENG